MAQLASVATEVPTRRTIPVRNSATGAAGADVPVTDREAAP